MEENKSKNIDMECDNIISILSNAITLQEKLLFFKDISSAKYIAILADLRHASESLLIETSNMLEMVSDTEHVNCMHGLGLANNVLLQSNASDLFVFQDLIIVKTPLTYNGDWKVSKLFGFFISPLIDAWNRIYGYSFFDTLSYPFICLVERCAHKFNARTMGDNDNLETSKIINEIVRATGTDDNPCIMHYGARFRKVQESDADCMYFYFVSCNYLKKHPDFLNNFFLG